MKAFRVEIIVWDIEIAEEDNRDLGHEKGDELEQSIVSEDTLFPDFTSEKEASAHATVVQNIVEKMSTQIARMAKGE